MKKAIAFSLIISASAAFAQTRLAESFRPANSARLMQCGYVHAEETTEEEHELLMKLKSLSGVNRNAVLSLLETLHRQEQEKQKKRLKVFHKEEEV